MHKIVFVIKPIKKGRHSKNNQAQIHSFKLTIMGIASTNSKKKKIHIVIRLKTGSHSSKSGIFT